MTCTAVTDWQLYFSHCLIAFASRRIARFIMNVEKQEERFTTGNFCLNQIVTWPWEQGHISKTEGHIETCHLQKALKVNSPKYQTFLYLKKLWRPSKKRCLRVKIPLIPGSGIHPNPLLPQVWARVKPFINKKSPSRRGKAPEPGTVPGKHIVKKYTIGGV